MKQNWNSDYTLELTLCCGQSNAPLSTALDQQHAQASQNEDIKLPSPPEESTVLYCAFFPGKLTASVVKNQTYRGSLVAAFHSPISAAVSGVTNFLTAPLYSLGSLIKNGASWWWSRGESSSRPSRPRVKAFCGIYCNAHKNCRQRFHSL